TYNVFGQSAISNIFSKIDSVPNQYNAVFGYKYDLSFSKISGKFTFDVKRSGINPTYNNNDMGITRETNFNYNGLTFSFNQYTPFRSFISAGASLSVNHSENFSNHVTNNLNFNLETRGTFKNFYDIYFGGSAEPIESIDYYEARTPGRIFIRPTNQTFWTGVNTDRRKRFNLSFNTYAGRTGLISNTIGYNPYYGVTLSPRLRANDRLSFEGNFTYSQDLGDRGYVNKDENSNIIFGLRFINSMENILAVRYLFRNNLSLSLRGRHYWTGGHYKSFYNLSEEGRLIDNVSYDHNHDFNFNAFNIDMNFQWQFAPGSFLNIVWKNSIYNESKIVVNNYSKNLESTLEADQLNSVSLKIVYFFDYLYLRKKRV
ncbi:MAG TPA: DUF5916 domain-containing protein, partial [Bacteroidia bacterium]